MRVIKGDRKQISLISHRQYLCWVINIFYLLFLQAGDKQFNRGKLMNVGYLEALKLEQFDCFVFQDADLLPETDKNLYMCDPHAHHLASAINEMRYQLVL